MIPLIAAESTGLASLGLNLPALLFQLVNFGILFWILKRYAYKPILNALEQRRSFIEKSLADAEAARAERDKVVAERTEMLEKARKQASTIVSDARGEGEQQKQGIITEAESSADHIIDSAKRETERQLKEARTKLQTEARDLVIGATSELIDEKLDAKKDAALLDKALAGAGRRG